MTARWTLRVLGKGLLSLLGPALILTAWVLSWPHGGAALGTIAWGYYTWIWREDCA